MTPLVSVVIPSFNRPLLLKRRSIPSVLRQTYSNWEIIVVGDGPEDNSLQRVVEDFCDPRIRYAEIQRPDYRAFSKHQLWHAAGAAARNYGVQQARGEIIAPLDDDDEFLPNHLADCVSLLSRGSVDFVYGFVFQRDLQTCEDTPEDWLSWDDPQTREEFLKRNIIFLPSVAYVRRYAHIPYPTDGAQPADYACWLAMYAAGARFASIHRPQAVYYGDNLTARIKVSVPPVPPAEGVQIRLGDVRRSCESANGAGMYAGLEREILERVGIPCVVISAGYDKALMVAFQALQASTLARRREVVLPSYAQPSLVEAAFLSGLEPVFCDIDPETLCITAGTVQSLVSSHTAVIAAFHAHGNRCDIQALDRVARSANVSLLGVATDGFGAGMAGSPIRSWCDAEVLRLASSNSSDVSEGAFLCSHDDRVLEYARCHKSDSNKISNLDQASFANCAATALSTLAQVNSWLARRREALAIYQRRLSIVPCVRFQRTASGDAPGGCHEAVLILPSSAQVQSVRRHLSAYRIESEMALEPLHQMPAYRSFRHGELAVTEQIAACAIRIPLYGTIRDEVIDLVVDAVLEALA